MALISFECCWQWKKMQASHAWIFAVYLLVVICATASTSSASSSRMFAWILVGEPDPDALLL
jgi:hypothetical protein